MACRVILCEYMQCNAQLQMNGAVCADAFMFWWMAVEEATIDHPAPLNMVSLCALSDPGRKCLD